MSYILTPIDDFNRPDSPNLGPAWRDEKVFPPHLHIVDGHAVGGLLSIAGAAYIGSADPAVGMVLPDIDLHEGLAQLSAGIADITTRDGAPYGDPTYTGGTAYIFPGYRAQFGPLSVDIVQVEIELVDVGEAFPVATSTTTLLAHLDVALPTGPVELAIVVNGDEIIAYANGTVVLTALGTGGLGIGGGQIAFWLQGNAVAGGAGGVEPPPPPPPITPVSLNHPLSNRLLDGPRLSSPPPPGVSLNAKLLAGA